MKDWEIYSQAKANKSGVSGGKPPNVWEYACIKIIDNGALVMLVALIVVFAGGGGALYIFGSSDGSKIVANWFFDAAKLCLGVLLGVWSQRKKR